MKHDATSSDMHAPTVFTLRTGIAEGRMVYIGVGGDINGVVNPTLLVHEGETVQINLINGEGAEHDVVIDQMGRALEPGRRQGRQQRGDIYRIKNRGLPLLLFGAGPSRSRDAGTNSSCAGRTLGRRGDGCGCQP